MRTSSDGSPRRRRNDFYQSGYQLDAWGFPFHESCWKILALVRPGDEVNVQALFDICRSFPVQNNMINYGHDYGGMVLNEASDHSAESARMEPQYYNYPPYPADPLGIPELRRKLEAECLGPPARAEVDVAPQTQYPITRADAFSKLPPEVLQHILEYLPTGEIIPLKQSSKTFANLPILQPFWRSRFLPGGELECVFETRGLARRLGGRWRSAYRTTAAALRGDDAKNRARIWELACGMWKLMDVVNAGGLRGDEDGLGSLRWVVASRALRAGKAEFTHGSRDLFRRTLALSPGAVSVCVSLVEVFGRHYVSAIRLDQDGGSEVLGYQHGPGEVLLTTCTSGISGFYLAHDGRGVRGIAVLSGTGSAVSPWAGDHEGIPSRKLVFDNVTSSQSSIRYLKGGFDVCLSFHSFRNLHYR